MRGTPKNAVRFLGTPTRPYEIARKVGTGAFPLDSAWAKPVPDLIGDRARAVPTLTRELRLLNDDEYPPEVVRKDRPETRPGHRLPAEDDRDSERHRRRSENPEVPCGLSRGYRARRGHVGDELGRAEKASSL